jgi:hypothetical protein
LNRHPFQGNDVPKLKPYRCQNEACSEDAAGRLIFDFWTERPICPKCGTDGKQMPDIVIPLAVVHFDPPSHVKNRGQRIAACDSQGYGGRAVSGNPNVVNCPECRATAAWKTTAEDWGVEELTDESIEEAEAVLQAGKAELEALSA